MTQMIEVFRRIEPEFSTSDYEYFLNETIRRAGVQDGVEKEEFDALVKSLHGCPDKARLHVGNMNARKTIPNADRSRYCKLKKRALKAVKLIHILLGLMLAGWGQTCCSQTPETAKSESELPIDAPMQLAYPSARQLKFDTQSTPSERWCALRPEANKGLSVLASYHQGHAMKPKILPSVASDHQGQANTTKQLSALALAHQVNANFFLIRPSDHQGSAIKLSQSSAAPSTSEINAAEPMYFQMRPSDHPGQASKLSKSSALASAHQGQAMNADRLQSLESDHQAHALQLTDVPVFASNL